MVVLTSRAKDRHAPSAGRDHTGGGRRPRRRSWAGRRIGLWLAVLALAMGPGPTGPETGLGQGGPSQEYQVKAVFLSKFASFIVWPDEAFSGAGSPMTIGLWGADPFGRHLEDAVAGEVINGRALTVRKVEQQEDVRSCHILFVNEPDPARLTALLESVRGRPVLTVGQTNQFLRQGGIINFVLREGRVRIEVNPDEAEKAGLKIHSKLLSVATIAK